MTPARPASTAAAARGQAPCTQAAAALSAWHRGTRCIVATPHPSTPLTPAPSPQVQENVQCEIMMVVLEEALDSYREELVRPLASNSVEQMESNVEAVVTWARQWRGA